VRVERHTGVAPFLERAGAFLEQREAEHNLILGLCATLAREPHAFGGGDPYLATVEEGGAVVAAGLRTPPHNLVLSESADERVWAALASDVLDVDRSLPGLLASPVAAARFIRVWQESTGADAGLARSQRIYRAEGVSPPEGVPGTMRPYAETDRPLALAWLDAFFVEAIGSTAVETPERTLEHRLADPAGGVVVWDDGGPVSLAGFGGPTPNGIRIGPVYTPPELRRRGYASALTAELTRFLLAGGRRFCFLFTDLANPTSNSIYRRVGYVPVTDVEEWRFGAAR
jgi:predicted GNAT family acetyltransferase